MDETNRYPYAKFNLENSSKVKFLRNTTFCEFFIAKKIDS